MHKLLAAPTSPAVTPEQRAAVLGQQPCAIWLTGLSGAGKTTIAQALEQRMLALQRPSMLLDGDALRDRLNHDLGFSDADRAENVRRVAEVARLMLEAGLFAIVALISPHRTARDQARAMFGPGDFIEVHVDTPLVVAESRDPKGLYRRARSGQIPQFTGIASPYEPPLAPELRIATVRSTPAEAAQQIIDLLVSRGRLEAARTEARAPISAAVPAEGAPKEPVEAEPGSRVQPASA